MKVIIECINNQIISDYCFKGWTGAVNSGHDVRLMDLPNISVRQYMIKRDKPLPIGSISYMEYFFKLYDINKPLPLHCTSNLMKNEYKVINSKYDITYPAFVKPHLDIKKFTGFVAKSLKDFDLYPELNDWDGPYFVREPFCTDIISEWRCFIHKNKIINCSYYNGINPLSFPSFEMINNTIKEYENAPIAYTLDVAVLKNGYTILVELNDMWAIGPYGCNETDYFNMLKDRWSEIIKNKQ